jgi:hypothetical protein
MEERTIPIPPGYDRSTQYLVGLFAAQFDDQSIRLKKHVTGLTVEQLEWQLRPGMNTIGMLLAHLAVVEIWWIVIAPVQEQNFDSAEGTFKEIIGIGGDDDGLPIKPDGRHPETLRGKTIEDYLSMLEKARAAVHRALQGWTDDRLETMYQHPKSKISHSWTLYHVLEHYAGHFGQILLLKHLMRDAGVLVEEKK